MYNNAFLFQFPAMFLTLKLISRKRTNNSRVSSFLFVVINTFLAACFYLLFSGDVERNPGKKGNSQRKYVCPKLY